MRLLTAGFEVQALAGEPFDTNQKAPAAVARGFLHPAPPQVTTHSGHVTCASTLSSPGILRVLTASWHETPDDAQSSLFGPGEHRHLVNRRVNHLLDYPLTSGSQALHSDPGRGLNCTRGAWWWRDGWRFGESGVLINGPARWGAPDCDADIAGWSRYGLENWAERKRE